MQKGINSDSQIHISVAFLIKGIALIVIVLSSWYQAQMRFQEISIRLNDMEDRVTLLTSAVKGMEQEHMEKLEAEVKEQRSLLQKMGFKKP